MAVIWCVVLGDRPSRARIKVSGMTSWTEKKRGTTTSCPCDLRSLSTCRYLVFSVLGIPSVYVFYYLTRFQFECETILWSAEYSTKTGAFTPIDLLFRVLPTDVLVANIGYCRYNIHKFVDNYLFFNFNETELNCIWWVTYCDKATILLIPSYLVSKFMIGSLKISKSILNWCSTFSDHDFFKKGYEVVTWLSLQLDGTQFCHILYINECDFIQVWIGVAADL
jgi:hypothetical protein